MWRGIPGNPCGGLYLGAVPLPFWGVELAQGGWGGEPLPGHAAATLDPDSSQDPGPPPYYNWDMWLSHLAILRFKSLWIRASAKWLKCKNINVMESQWNTKLKYHGSVPSVLAWNSLWCSHSLSLLNLPLKEDKIEIYSLFCEKEDNPLGIPHHFNVENWVIFGRYVSIRFQPIFPLKTTAKRLLNSQCVITMLSTI